MEKKIKMIGFDLDGTLLTRDKRITDFTRKTLEQAIAEGVVVLPATGRPISGVPEELLTFPGIRYAVTANGARVADLKKGCNVYECLVSAEKVRKILDICREYDTLIEIYYDGTGYIDIEKARRADRYVWDSEMVRYLLNTRLQIHDIHEKAEKENRDMDKVQAFFACMNEREAAWERLEKIGGLAISESQGNNLEINAEGVHKGRALIRLGELLGIKREEIMAFGDEANDIEMLKSVGVGVAMANASQEVKSAADCLTASNGEDGVARFIQSHVLG